MIVIRKFHILIILFAHVACSGKQEEITKEFGQDDGAVWIRDGRALPGSDSLFYLDQPAPLFRKEFKSVTNIDSAKLWITAAGYYKATINGKPAGRNVLDPAWTDFSKRIYYAEYDVDSLLDEGDNCLGVTLGNGFYNPLPLRKWGHRNLRNDLTVGKPAFIAKLIIYYRNGTTKIIVSDPSWKYAYGPLMKNSVYIGVLYDARNEIKDWNLPGFDDRFWMHAQEGNGPGGRLQKAFFPPVRVTREIEPVEIFTHKPGICIVDMGVNFTGTYKIKLSGNRGDTIVFRFGERLYEDGQLNPMTTVAGQIKGKGIGGPGAPDIAWQTDRYVLGDTTAWFSPGFTYHTFRYMEITGLDFEPQKEDITGLFLHSNVAGRNHFTSSSQLLNAIQDATQRTFRANLVSVQSDCPAREKFGYGGDLNATSESFIYNFDMQAFYRKTVYDWVDAMNDSVFIDTAPYTGIKYCGISWESAFLLTQYVLYLYYNDTAMVREMYPLDQMWMEKAARIHPGGVVDEGLSDHESLEPVPVQLTGTCHYLQCARIMKKFASVMGDLAAEKKYERLAQKLQSLVKEEFWDRPVTGEINRQTLFATLLYHGIIPSNESEIARDSLIKAIQNGPSGHFTTGIFGTKYILESLSEYGSPGLVFDIVNSSGFPGWGYMIHRGATTLWETWKESDNTYSNCHPMFGSVSEWFYRWLGGIRPDPENPGFRKFTIHPSFPEGLQFVDCTYHSPFGPIVSNWQKEEPGMVRFEITIPEGTTAHVILPASPSQEIMIESGDPGFNPDTVAGIQTGNFSLNGGDYIIKFSPAIP